MSKSLRFSPYVCPECQSLVMNFETVDGVDICGLCETPLIEYKAIPAAELAALTQRAEKADDAKLISDNLLFDIYKFFQTEIKGCSGIGCEMEIDFINSIDAYFYEHAADRVDDLQGEV